MRFLTPAKVGFLVLIDMYVNNAIPNECHHAILDFLTLHLMGIDLQQLQHKASAKRFRSEFGRMRSVEATVSVVASMSVFEELLNELPSSLENHSLWEIFLLKMWAINSLNEMNVFVLGCPRRLMHRFTETNVPDTLLDESESDQESGDDSDSKSGEDDETQKLPKKLRLSPNSPIGVFVRECRSEILKQNFMHTGQLWQAFISYRQPTVPLIRRLQPGMGKYCFDDVLGGESETWLPEDVGALAGVTYGDMLTGETTDGVPISMHDLERLVATVGRTMTETRGRVPLEVRHQLEDLIKDAKSLPKGIHHLRYLEAWQARDYTATFDQIHRFCDYSPSNRDRQAYQCALMTLAQTNSDFGCFGEAATAMTEAISTARENGDTQTLIHCLNWMYNFSITQPALLQELNDDTILADHRETLSYLKMKSAEVGLSPNIVGAYFLEANLGLQMGNSMASVVESMTRANHLIGSNGLAFMLGLNSGTKARVWVRMGTAALALIEQEVFLRSGVVFSDLANLIDCVTYLAVMYSFSGRYKEALAIIDDLHKSFEPLLVPTMIEKILKTRGVVRFREDLNNGNLDGAQEILSQLLQSPDGIPHDSSFNSLLRLEYLYRRNQIPKALELVDGMAKILDESKYEAATHMKLLLMKARIFSKCQKPLRGFTIASRAAKLALDSCSVESVCEAMGLLANILNSLGEFRAALELLNAALPRVLETENVAIAGEMYSFLADAYMGIAGQASQPVAGLKSRASAPLTPPALSPEQASHRKANMSRAMVALDRAFVQFEAIGDRQGQCDTLAKKATIFRISGEKELAEETATRFMDIKAM
uniref:Anaphase-promoting complex subunit 5 n=1 Tax=Berkeleyomyces basicola TaxID=124036 RepID=A0A3G2LVY1_9PEZI|nr:anaphase promoting complex subunit 5 [Berkeleyomyces basicola]